MDQTAKIWDIESGKCISTLKVKCSFKGHDGEIVALHFSSEGDRLITASFDNTARVGAFFNFNSDLGHAQRRVHPRAAGPPGRDLFSAVRVHRRVRRDGLHRPNLQDLGRR